MKKFDKVTGKCTMPKIMKAVEVSPVTHSFYDDGSAWAELQERWQHS